MPVIAVNDYDNDFNYFHLRTMILEFQIVFIPNIMADDHKPRMCIVHATLIGQGGRALFYACRAWVKSSHWLHRYYTNLKTTFY